MSVVPLSNDEKVALLVQLAPAVGLPMEKLLAIYVLLGDSLFFVLDILQDTKVSFPTNRALRMAMSRISEYRLLKLTKPSYRVNGRVSPVGAIGRGDTVEVLGENLVAISPPVDILGGLYVVFEGNAP